MEDDAVARPVDGQVRALFELRDLAQEGAALHSEEMPERQVCDGLLWALAEIERLHAVVKAANDQAERFERGWYLRGDALEKIEQWATAYPLNVFPEPRRDEWQRAAALLSEKGLSLDRISASNMRHVISGVRKLVDEGLKA